MGKVMIALLLCSSILQYCAFAGTSTVTRCKPNFALAEQMMETALRKNLRFAAGFIRASFHDCFTTMRHKKNSGCNGSLRLRVELGAGNNRGIEDLTNFFDPIARKTCISSADAIQIGTEKAMKLTGGPSLSLGRGRVDVALPDDPTELPGLDSFAVLKALYARKGFSVREMVVSIVGGHALGKFFGLNFTPNPNSFDNMFAVNLLHVHKNSRDMGGFNSLPSDRALLSDKEARMWVTFYADRSVTGNGVRRGVERLQRDFKLYLEKQSKMGTHA